MHWQTYERLLAELRVLENDALEEAGRLVAHSMARIAKAGETTGGADVEEVRAFGLLVEVNQVRPVKVSRARAVGRAAAGRDREAQPSLRQAFLEVLGEVNHHSTSMKTTDPRRELLRPRESIQDC